MFSKLPFSVAYLNVKLPQIKQKSVLPTEQEQKYNLILDPQFPYNNDKLVPIDSKYELSDDNDGIYTEWCKNIGYQPIKNVNVDIGGIQVDYVWMSYEERKEYAKSSHEYLISQLSETEREIADTNDHLFSVDCLDHECEWSLLSVDI